MRDMGMVSTAPNLLQSGCVISGMPISPPAGAAGFAAGAGAAATGALTGACATTAAPPLPTLRTSASVMRPFAPVPATFARSMPNSRAMRRTDGLA